MSQVVLLVLPMLAAFVHGTCRRVRIPVLQPRRRDIHCAQRVSLRALVRAHRVAQRIANIYRTSDIVPIKAAFNLVRAVTGSSAQVARVSVQIECEDSVSHKLLTEAVITGVGQRKFIEGQPITWPEVEPVLAS